MCFYLCERNTHTKREKLTDSLSAGSLPRGHSSWVGQAQAGVGLLRVAGTQLQPCTFEGTEPGLEPKDAGISLKGQRVAGVAQAQSLPRTKGPPSRPPTAEHSKGC